MSNVWFFHSCQLLTATARYRRTLYNFTYYVTYYFKIKIGIMLTLFVVVVLHKS